MSNKLRKSNKKKVNEDNSARRILMPEFDPYVSDGHRLFIIRQPKFIQDMLKGGGKYGNVTSKH